MRMEKSSLYSRETCIWKIAWIYRIDQKAIACELLVVRIANSDYLTRALSSKTHWSHIDIPFSQTRSWCSVACRMAYYMMQQDVLLKTSILVRKRCMTREKQRGGRERNRETERKREKERERERERERRVAGEQEINEGIETPWASRDHSFSNLTTDGQLCTTRKRQVWLNGLLEMS